MPMGPQQGLDGLPPEMLQAAREADAVHDEVDAFITALTAEVEAQSAHWRGTAPGALYKEYGDFLTAGAEVKRWLLEIGAAAGASGGAYDTADFEATAAMGTPAAPGIYSGLTETSPAA
jgi:uncharacterized protein YukE